MLPTLPFAHVRCVARHGAVVLLGLASCMTPTQGEDRSSSRTVAFNEVVERTVEIGDTVHFAVAEGQRDVPFSLLLQAVTGTASATVRDTAGRQVGSIADTASGRPLGARGTDVIGPPFQQGPYRVIVTGAGRFRVQAYRPDPAPESAARAMAPGDTVTRETLLAGADVDEFTFEGGPGEEYVAYLQASDATTPARPFLSVRRQGTTTDLTDAIGAAARESFETGMTRARLVLATGGTYTLRVRAKVNEPFAAPYMGAYRLALRRVDRGPERVAAVIGRAPRTIEEEIDYAGDVDEYPVAGAPGDEYNLFFQAPDAEPAAPLRLQVDGVSALGSDPRGTQSDRRDTLALGRSTGRFALSASGRATLRVLAGDARLARGRYRLTVYPVDRRPETARSTLAPGDSVLDESMERDGDVDEYTVDVPESTYVNLITELAPAPGPLRQPFFVRVVRAGQRAADLNPTTRNAVPAGSTHPVRFVTGVIQLPPGRHTIAVSTGDYASTTNLLGGHYVGRYRLWLRTFRSTPETRPAAFAVGDRVSESADPAGDFDEYTTGGRRGDDLQVVARALGPGGACDGFLLRLWRHTGIWIPTADVVAPAGVAAGARSPRFSIDSTQPLRVDVGRGNDTTFGDCGAYEFTVVRYPTGPERHPAELAVGETVNDERLDEPGDIDEFTVRAAPGTALAIETSAGDGTAGLYTQLLDPETRAVLVSSGSYAQTEISLPVRVPASGRLVLRVSEPSYANPVVWRLTGGYQVRVILAPAASGRS